MNWDKAIEMIESGDARMVLISAVFIAEGGRMWMSFDGNEWEQIDSELARREVR